MRLAALCSGMWNRRLRNPNSALWNIGVRRVLLGLLSETMGGLDKAAQFKEPMAFWRKAGGRVT